MSEAGDQAGAGGPGDEDDGELNMFKVSEGVDWFLAYLVHWANDIGFEFGITLNVGGALVSGLVISGANYFKEFAANYASGISDPSLSEGLERMFGQFSVIYEIPEEDQKLKGPPPSFIHLRNAKLYQTSGNPIPSGRGVLWRGKLSDVHGFSLGSLEVG